MKEISVIVLTHDSYRLKQGSVETVIFSMLSQVNVSIELIVVDNGSQIEDKVKLKRFTDRVNDNRIKLIQLQTNNISMGRNEGIKNASAQLVVFVDDDCIMTRYDILSDVLKKSTESEYGCFANRIWTEPAWYPSQKRVVENKLILRNKLTFEFKDVNPNVRNKTDDRHLRKTYIGNFGFSKLEALEAVGGWNEHYVGYGAEDDDLLFRLYNKYGKPCLLSDIDVLHVFHEIKESDYTSLKINTDIFKGVLKKEGIKEFHIGRLMHGEDDIIEYL